MLRMVSLLLMLALISPAASAITGMFWQPQLRDANISAPQWVTLMSRLRQQGIDTLVVQWTQYGPAFSDESGSKLLLQRINAARDAGLKVIVGLHADPEFFSRQKQTGAALTHYLARLRIADILQAKREMNQRGFQPQGWYISAEIDDLNWRGPQARTQLLRWLSETRSQLKAVDNQPVYISSFFAGHMTPDDYQQMVAQIRQSGINVWVQDGRGVNTLSSSECQRYLDATAQCAGSTPASGIVYEIFHQIAGKTFRGVPLPEEETRALMAQKSACDKDRLYFELRYAPAAQGIMQYD
ncbi:hypothetical protein BTJ39_17815 [Izhakiella australiensis]|uniref:DUF4434 domain-containing protein n=1 Tax=Izhakiella australiensis TaxID=1926881 RepID=A0A1S8YI62_9GAMM|nr:DUF4434 family protein [Izhakiella australiensis]OON38517.1 hypothetical protein BTJ39_17815 [Izhakiella australiensis]